MVVEVRGTKTQTLYYNYLVSTFNLLRNKDRSVFEISIEPALLYPLIVARLIDVGKCSTSSPLGVEGRTAFLTMGMLFFCSVLVSRQLMHSLFHSVSDQ
jgi:hypothetical protein